MNEKQKAQRDLAIDMLGRVVDIVAPKLSNDARLGMSSRRDVELYLQSAVDAIIAAAKSDQ